LKTKNNNFQLRPARQAFRKAPERGLYEWIQNPSKSPFDLKGDLY